MPASEGPSEGASPAGRKLREEGEWHGRKEGRRKEGGREGCRERKRELFAVAVGKTTPIRMRQNDPRTWQNLHFLKHNTEIERQSVI